MKQILFIFALRMARCPSSIVVQGRPIVLQTSLRPPGEWADAPRLESKIKIKIYEINFYFNFPKTCLRRQIKPPTQNHWPRPCLAQAGCSPAHEVIAAGAQRVGASRREGVQRHQRAGVNAGMRGS